MAQKENNICELDSDHRIMNDPSPLLSDIMMLFPVQADSIRQEAVSILNTITDDFLEHYADIGHCVSEPDIVSKLQNGCMTIIERLQYIDILSQRLCHLEQGLQHIAVTLTESSDIDNKVAQHVDVTAVLSQIIESCRMEQEKTLMEEYLQGRDISTDQIFK